MSTIQLRRNRKSANTMLGYKGPLENVQKTCLCLVISRKIFYKWKTRFDQAQGQGSALSSIAPAAPITHTNA